LLKIESSEALARGKMVVFLSLGLMFDSSLEGEEGREDASMLRRFRPPKMGERRVRLGLGLGGETGRADSLSEYVMSDESVISELNTVPDECACGRTVCWLINGGDHLVV